VSRLFAAVAPVHVVPGRARLRYRLVAGADDAGIEAALRELAGVTEVRVGRKARSVTLRFDGDITDAQTLRAALLDVEVGAAGTAGAAAKAEGGGSTLRAAAMLLASRALPPPARMMATAVAAAPVLRKALRDLPRAGVTSHVLEALAVAISIARRDFGAAGATTFMLGLGEALEEGIGRRSDEMLKRLLRPNTGHAWIEEGGGERQVDAAELRVGMTVVVGAGATIPVDGTVLGGEALVNEAAMTGESAPRPRRRGDRALSGTVVEEGRLRIYAEHVGRHTAAARITDYVERALTAKSRRQVEAARLADRLVPAVLGFGGAAWLLTGDWRRAASVLQADYSCALKLATPVAFKSAMSRAGGSGILFKGADALERLAEADTFVFDKTGTLTTGRLAVTDSVAFDADYSPGDLIDLAASVEEHYFHPLALAVVEAARRHHGRHFDHQEVEFIAAHGVASTIDGRRIVVGSRHFVEDDECVKFPPRSRGIVNRLFRQGKTLLYIGFGGRLLGVIALKDEVRATAAATLARLRALGAKRVLMLTGDHQARAAELSRMLGLDGHYAELLPEGKAAIVARLAKEGARIAFVGDGINDAPALAGAHVGIAMCNGADIARLTSDIVLLEDRLERVADAKSAAVATMALIERNFRLTVGLNSGILAAAAAGRLTPVASSVLHNGSTIGILLKALAGGARTLP